MFKKIIIIFAFLFVAISAQEKIDFTAKTLKGKKIKLSQFYKEGPTLVSFWALWCQPCRKEMTKLNSIYKKYKDKGFNIIGINLDSPRSTSKVKSYVVSHKIKFPIVKDPEKELFQLFNGQSIPLLFLLDKTGKIINTHIGYVPGDEKKLEKEITDLLGAEE